jgi:hypothetical protein
MARKKKTNANESDGANERIEKARRDGATTLALSGLKLTSVTRALTKLTSLQHLLLRSNRLRAAPEKKTDPVAFTEQRFGPVMAARSCVRVDAGIESMPLYAASQSCHRERVPVTRLREQE